MSGDKMNALKTIAAVGVTALAVARLTRFITTDTLGEWAIVGRAKLWAIKREAPKTHNGPRSAVLDANTQLALGEPVDTPPAAWGWRSKLVSALDCPYCVGQWFAAAGVVALAVYRAKATPKLVKAAIGIVGSALAMNYVTGNVNARLD